MKQLAVLIAILLLAAIVYVSSMILFGWITKFRPAPVEEVMVQNPEGNKPSASITDSTLSFLIWNIGYGGLGKEVDFFYDGGKMVTSPKAHVMKNIEGMSAFLKQQTDIDFLIFQEVDRNSKRSYKTDQSAIFSAIFNSHYSAFTPNYDVVYLPFPFTDPIGKVYGGLQSLTRYKPASSQRIALPGITDFPRKLFYLERCLLLQKFPLQNGKELVVINAHFEAYDDGGIKKQQMEVTRQIAEAEYARGNYVVIGGDWNIAPPDFNVRTFEKTPEDDPLYLKNNDANYIPGWSYVYDAKVPTNRKNKTEYNPEKTFTTVIDYYFVSPNMEVQEVKGINLGFEYSDHQPVKMMIKLK